MEDELEIEFVLRLFRLSNLTKECVSEIAKLITVNFLTVTSQTTEIVEV